MNRDLVRDYLGQRGCPDFVVDGGIGGLVERWERTVGEVEGGYDATLDEYLNDLDGRQILNDVLTRFPEPDGSLIDRMRDADQRMRLASRSLGRCLWGDERSRVWTEQRSWWYYRVPLSVGDDFREDFRRAEDPLSEG